jgi:hypothetical protein
MRSSRANVGAGARGGPREKLMLRYRRRLLLDEHEPRTLDEKRAAYALAGAKLIPAVLSTGPYAATEEELRATTKPRVPAVHIHGPEVDRRNPNELTSHSFVMQPPRHPDYFKRLVAALGEAVDDEKQSSSIEADFAALRAKRAERGFAHSRDENEHAFRARRREAHRRASPRVEQDRRHVGRGKRERAAGAACSPRSTRRSRSFLSVQVGFFTQCARDAVARVGALTTAAPVEGMQLYKRHAGGRVVILEEPHPGEFAREGQAR